jgi:hypothetical protein
VLLAMLGTLRLGAKAGEKARDDGKIHRCASTSPAYRPFCATAAS